MFEHTQYSDERADKALFTELEAMLGRLSSALEGAADLEGGDNSAAVNINKAWAEFCASMGYDLRRTVFPGPKAAESQARSKALWGVVRLPGTSVSGAVPLQDAGEDTSAQPFLETEKMLAKEKLSGLLNTLKGHLDKNSDCSRFKRFAWARLEACSGRERHTYSSCKLTGLCFFYAFVAASPFLEAWFAASYLDEDADYTNIAEKWPLWLTQHTNFVALFNSCVQLVHRCTADAEATGWKQVLDELNTLMQAMCLPSAVGAWVAGTIERELLGVPASPERLLGRKVLALVCFIVQHVLQSIIGFRRTAGQGVECFQASASLAAQRSYLFLRFVFAVGLIIKGRESEDPSQELYFKAAGLSTYNQDGDQKWGHQLYVGAWVFMLVVLEPLLARITDYAVSGAERWCSSQPREGMREGSPSLSA
jgi:hypothetical protein